MSQPEALLVPVQHLQEIANYLQKRPWEEVNHLLGHLANAKPPESEHVDDGTRIPEYSGPAAAARG